VKLKRMMRMKMKMKMRMRMKMIQRLNKMMWLRRRRHSNKKNLKPRSVNKIV
jgi:hypothetical protein